MSDAMTSDKLIDSIKRRASIPSNQSTFTKEDFLEFANEELLLGVVPAIMTLHEDFFLFEKDLAIQPNKNSYEIPSRAVGNKLRDVQRKIDSGKYMEMTRIGIGDRFDDFQSITYTGLSQYYIKNNKVVLLQDVGSSPTTDKLTMVFYIKPSKLVLEEKVGVISGINRTTGDITLVDFPEDFNSSLKYDFYKSGSPYTILDIDLVPVSVNVATKSVRFDPNSIPDELVVGDHLARAGECMIPQVPTELQVMLSQMVACRVLESIGDTEGLQNALLKLQQMQQAAGILIDNRVDDSPQKVVNRRGLLRSSVFNRRFNRRY